MHSGWVVIVKPTRSHLAASSIGGTIMGIEISKSATINVSADKLWSILADDFDKIGTWARGVDSSAPNPKAEAPQGATVGGHVCQAPGFGAIDESFTSFDAEQRSYSFHATASKIPSFVRNLTNYTAVKELGPEKSEVQLKITADHRRHPGRHREATDGSKVQWRHRQPHRRSDDFRRIGEGFER